MKLKILSLICTLGLFTLGTNVVAQEGKVEAHTATTENMKAPTASSESMKTPAGKSAEKKPGEPDISVKTVISGICTALTPVLKIQAKSEGLKECQAVCANAGGDDSANWIDAVPANSINNQTNGQMLGGCMQNYLSCYKTNPYISPIISAISTFIYGACSSLACTWSDNVKTACGYAGCNLNPADVKNCVSNNCTPYNITSKCITETKEDVEALKKNK